MFDLTGTSIRKREEDAPDLLRLKPAVAAGNGHCFFP